MIAAALVAIAAAAVTQPTYLVERVVTLGGTTTRLSVFRNGVAVLARSAPGERAGVVRQPLSEVEVAVLAQVVEECYPDLVRFGELGKGPGDGTAEIRLAPPGKEPLRIRFALTAASTTATARLTQALDGVEARLERTNVSRDDLHEWEPSVGDRVELEDGRVVEVLEVLAGPDGAIVHARVGEGPVSIFLSTDDLRRLALRRVAR